jgi:hypothetical protein
MTEEEYTLNAIEAITIAKALIHYNNHLLAEYNKIIDNFGGQEDASEFIRKAAVDEYQMLSQPATEIHIKLAEAFLALRQV